MRRGLLCIILYNSLPFSVMAEQLKQSKNQPRWEKREREREKRGGREVTKKYIIHKKIDNGSSFQPTTRAYLEIGISFSCERSISNSFWWGSRNQVAAAPSSSSSCSNPRAHLPRHRGENRLICDLTCGRGARHVEFVASPHPWLYKL